MNSAALNEERLAVNQFEAGPQILLIAACPLPGPISGLTAWTMTASTASPARATTC